MSKILIVDDQADVLSTLGRALTRLGHEVFGSIRAEDAVRALADQEVDLVITDIAMPGMDGIELIVHVRESAPDVPIIALSGGGLLPPELLLDSAGALGAVTTLRKPVGLRELERAVAGALGEAGTSPS